MTETWNSCAQLPLLPKLLCPLLSPLGQAFQRLVIHTAVTVHILELFPLPASLAPLPVFTNPQMPARRSQYTKALSLIIRLSLVCLVHCCTFKSVFLHHTLPPFAVAYILWLFLGNCDSQHPLGYATCSITVLLPLSYHLAPMCLVLGHHTVILAFLAIN